MMGNNKLLNSAVQELRRGTLLLCVLSQLETPQYGYSLVQLLAYKDMIIDQNTLYPLLRRLESQGLLMSNWSIEESRPRKYYKISEEGRTFYNNLITEWNKNVKSTNKLIRTVQKG